MAHYWARELAGLGHDVRLMPPQVVRPSVKTKRTTPPMRKRFASCAMRLVPSNSAEQQTALLLHYHHVNQIEGDLFVLLRR